MIYRRRIPVEFNHCDAAGIVFYPRYFEMINSMIENFFGHVLGYGFARIHVEERCALPTAQIEVRFLSPTRLGEVLDFALEVEHVGRSSARFVQRASVGGQAKLQCVSTLVWVGRDGRPASWPQEIRSKMVEFKEKSDDA